MAVDIKKDEPIDPDSPDYRHLLEDLQGNILRGHGREHTILVLIRFKPKKQAQAKRFLRELAANHVTSAARQEEMRWVYERLKEDTREPLDKRLYQVPGQFLGGVFTNVFLTSSGYEFLGVPKTKTPKDEKFKDGMVKSRTKLNDPVREEWDEPYRLEDPKPAPDGKPSPKPDPDSQVIHAMILAADDDAAYLRRAVVEMLEGVCPVAEKIFFEQGDTLRNDEDQSIEHFGYEDGRSQPVFFKKDHDFELEQVPNKDGKKKFTWDPLAPLNLVLEKDPGGGKDGYGSYLVYRKLEQNVKKFRELAKALAKELGFEPDMAGAQRAGALLVGRFADATPVAMQDSATGRNPALNDFDYKDDVEGTKCPKHAHIRISNPRREKDRGERIARRGVPYGSRTAESLRWDGVEEPPEKDVGLLFLCFQRDIETQFEAIQKRANKPATFDPIIGRLPGNAVPPKQKWPSVWNSKDPKDLKDIGFHSVVTSVVPSVVRSVVPLVVPSAVPAVVPEAPSVVTLKGGEYFFAPSISFLKGLAKP